MSSLSFARPGCCSRLIGSVVFGYALMSFLPTAAEAQSDGLAKPAAAPKIAALDFAVNPPAMIPFSADEVGEGSSAYVGGSIGTVTGPFVGTDINTLVGAGTFYAHGYTGTNVAIANIEAGHVWSGHETLASTLEITNHGSALNEVDRHATWVGMILAGREAGYTPGAYQDGMAPDAQLYSGAIAAQWNGLRWTGGFTYFFSSMFDQYRRAFSTGMDVSGRRADVINSSFGGGDVTGTDRLAMATDGFAKANPRTLFVASAGNSGAGPNAVFAPASGYNNISVAALGPDPSYNTPSSFSSGGPNDYSDPSNGTYLNARQVVDIAAPGQQQSSAYYGGETGGNGTTDNPSVSGTGPTGAADGAAGGPDYYSRGIAGTSFAAPTVAGGAALLYDAAYSALGANPDARDARVIKSVLMNSADKTVGWDNGQIPHPNLHGGVMTTQGLDNRVGTGSLNLDKAYHQFLDGTTDVPGLGSGNLGLIAALGWDFGNVLSTATNDYFFNAPLVAGSTFTATLTWFRDRHVDALNNVFDDGYDDLDLELWQTVGGVPTTVISESISPFNSSEHFSFTLPFTGDYALRVRWTGELFDFVGDGDQETYGLAWSGVAVPEPASVALLAVATVAILAVAQRRRRALLS